MAIYLLDTSVIIDLRDGEPSTTTRVLALEGPALISIVSRVELEGGVYRDPGLADVRRVRLDRVLARLPVLDFDRPCGDAYRDIVQLRGYSRRKLLDRMIAAQALVHRATLVTLNAPDFADVPGLAIEAW